MDPALKSIYKKLIYSLILSCLGWIPFLNLILILPSSFYFAYKAFSEAKANKELKKSIRTTALCLSVLCMINAVCIFALALFFFIFPINE